jgi:5-(carboxyamino)imidazole ribonucleotide synthase
VRARFLVETCVTAGSTTCRPRGSCAERCNVATGGDREDLDRGHAGVQEIIPMRPGPDVLHVVQDRARPEGLAGRARLPGRPVPQGRTEDELREAAQALGGRCYVKATRGGYDGRGQDILTGPDDAARVWGFLGAVPVVVEKALELDSS